MKVSETGKQFIQKWEGGPLLTAYVDASGYSIGWGHFGAYAGQVITLEQAKKYFDDDLQIVENTLNNIGISFSQSQFDALADFIYNVGTGNFINSTLLKKIKAGDVAGAAVEFSKWVYSMGEQLPGLVARRAAEAAMFLSGDKKKVEAAGLIIAAGIVFVLFKKNILRWPFAKSIRK